MHRSPPLKFRFASPLPACHVEAAQRSPGSAGPGGSPRSRANGHGASLQPGRRGGDRGPPRHQDLHPGSAAPGPSQAVAGAAAGGRAPLGQLCGPAAVREAPQLRGAVQAAGAQRGVFPEQLPLRLPRPHRLLPHHLPPAAGGPGRVLRGLLPSLPAQPAQPAGDVRPGAQHGSAVWPGWGRLLPLLLAGGSWIRRLLGAGCHPGGDRLPRCLP